jgi:hypothetical protein
VAALREVFAADAGVGEPSSTLTAFCVLGGLVTLLYAMLGPLISSPEVRRSVRNYLIRAFAISFGFGSTGVGYLRFATNSSDPLTWAAAASGLLAGQPSSPGVISGMFLLVLSLAGAGLASWTYIRVRPDLGLRPTEPDALDYAVGGAGLHYAAILVRTANDWEVVAERANHARLEAEARRRVGCPGLTVEGLIGLCRAEAARAAAELSSAPAGGVGRTIKKPPFRVFVEAAGPSAELAGERVLVGVLLSETPESLVEAQKDFDCVAARLR